MGFCFFGFSWVLDGFRFDVLFLVVGCFKVKGLLAGGS